MNKILNDYGIMVFIILYKFVLEMLYIFYIHPLYEYMGFILDTNVNKMLFSWLIIILVTIILPKSKNTPSNLIAMIVFLLVIIPTSSIYWLKNEPTGYIVFSVISLMLSIFLVKVVPIIKFDRIKFPYYFFSIFCLTFSMLVLCVIVAFNGVPTLSALNLNNVYIVRNNFNYGFNFMQYLLTWQVWILNPYLMMIFLKNKKYKLMSLVITCQFFIYLYTGHKAYLGIIILILIISVFIKYKNFMLYILIGLIGSLVVAWGSLVFIANQWPMAIIVHRLLFLPAQISYQYVSYFSENGFVMLSHSIFEKLFYEPIYNQHPIKIIGEIYYDNNWPNTGYLSDAYMNFGYLGMIIFSILFGLILKLFDSFAFNLNKEIVTAHCVILVFYFIGGGLLTSLMNGGILFFMFLLLISPTYQNKFKERQYDEKDS